MRAFPFVLVALALAGAGSRAAAQDACGAQVARVEALSQQIASLDEDDTLLMRLGQNAQPFVDRLRTADIAGTERFATGVQRFVHDTQEGEQRATTARERQSARVASRFYKTLFELAMEVRTARGLGIDPDWNDNALTRRVGKLREGSTTRGLQRAQLFAQAAVADQALKACQAAQLQAGQTTASSIPQTYTENAPSSRLQFKPMTQAETEQMAGAVGGRGGPDLQPDASLDPSSLPIAGDWMADGAAADALPIVVTPFSPRAGWVVTDPSRPLPNVAGIRVLNRTTLVIDDWLLIGTLSPDGQTLTLADRQGGNRVVWRKGSPWAR